MNKLILKHLLLFLCFSFVTENAISQDPLRFRNKIESYKTADESVDYKNVVVFTGSSSILFWKTLGTDFPEYNVINRGFGGSQFSDLIYFSDQLILQYQPKKVFIYEGDNDLAEQKSVETILKDAHYLVSKIRRTLPNVEFFFIAPKPSVARWNLKDEYLNLNGQMKKWCDSDDHLYFVDVWTPMCDENGEVYPDLFIGDKLHMNAKGYAIWGDIVKPFLRD